MLYFILMFIVNMSLWVFRFKGCIHPHLCVHFLLFHFVFAKAVDSLENIDNSVCFTWAPCGKSVINGPHNVVTNRLCVNLFIIWWFTWNCLLLTTVNIYSGYLYWTLILYFLSLHEQCSESIWDSNLAFP